jgi:hypothetical protein
MSVDLPSVTVDSNNGRVGTIVSSEHIYTNHSLGWTRTRRSTAKLPLLTHLTIEDCYMLEALDDLLTHEYLPAIESVVIWDCPCLHWRSGVKLPPSLQKLTYGIVGISLLAFPTAWRTLLPLNHWR